MILDRKAVHAIRSSMPDHCLAQVLRRFAIVLVAMTVLVNAAPLKDLALVPGLWRFATELHADSANGERLSAPQVEREAHTICIVPGTDVARALFGGIQPKDCGNNEVNAANGKIDFASACSPDEDGVSMDLSGAGTYTSRTVSIALKVRGEGEGNNAIMTGSVEGTWLGDCQNKH
jgi:hypothetical protein